MIRTWMARWLGVHAVDAAALEEARGQRVALSLALDALHDRVSAVERCESVRAAEHAAALDSLTRLYKRVASRLARENGLLPSGEEQEPESPLALRRRLRP